MRMRAKLAMHPFCMILLPVVASAGSECAKLDNENSRSWDNGFQLSVNVRSYQPFEHVLVEFAPSGMPGVRCATHWLNT